MRVVFLFCGLCLGLVTTGQSNLFNQLRTIIADTANKYAKFRGPLKSGRNGLDTTFLSTMQVEGTSDNEIDRAGWDNVYYWYYNAIIADSVKFNKAKKISDEWKRKIEKLFGSTFTVTKYKVVDFNPASYGWSFMCNGRSVISIWVMPLKEKGAVLNRVFLSL